MLVSCHMLPLVVQEYNISIPLEFDAYTADTARMMHFSHMRSKAMHAGQVKEII